MINIEFLFFSYGSIQLVVKEVILCNCVCVFQVVYLTVEDMHKVNLN